MQHTARALNIGEVVAILKEAIDGIKGGRDDEVVVVDKGDEGDEECTGETDGTAKNLNHAMFQFFIFSITISLFSSIIATILIFSARVGIIELAGLSVKLVTPRTSLILTLEEPWLFVFIFSG
ncbi:hypothetical protein JHK86_048265 [Glycine max]|nr:hypothetical protein JHK86_048265 [Glycine max]